MTSQTEMHYKASAGAFFQRAMNRQRGWANERELDQLVAHYLYELFMAGESRAEGSYVVASIKFCTFAISLIASQ